MHSFCSKCVSMTLKEILKEKRKIKLQKNVGGGEKLGRKIAGKHFPVSSNSLLVKIRQFH